MDFLPGGDLMTLLMRKDILSEEESRFYIAQTIISIESVHKVNFIHRDLKPENILVDENYNLKIADFGFSIPTVGPKGNGKLSSYKGTMGYMPPE